MSTELADNIVRTIEAAAEDGPPLLDDVIEARRSLQRKHSVVEMRKLQRRAVAFTSGGPAQALIWFQDVACDEAEKALSKLSVHIKSLISKDMQTAVATRAFETRAKMSLHFKGVWSSHCSLDEEEAKKPMQTTASSGFSLASITKNQKV